MKIMISLLLMIFDPFFNQNFVLFLLFFSQFLMVLIIFERVISFTKIIQIRSFFIPFKCPINSIFHFQSQFTTFLFLLFFLIIILFSFKIVDTFLSSYSKTYRLIFLNNLFNSIWYSSLIIILIKNHLTCLFLF